MMSIVNSDEYPNKLGNSIIVKNVVKFCMYHCSNGNDLASISTFKTSLQSQRHATKVNESIYFFHIAKQPKMGGLQNLID